MASNNPRSLIGLLNQKTGSGQLPNNSKVGKLVEDLELETLPTSKLMKMGSLYKYYLEDVASSNENTFKFVSICFTLDGISHIFLSILNTSKTENNILFGV